MRLLNFVRNIIFFSALLLCSIVRAEPMLNGIASHQELGKEQFIGALFSESLSNNADTLLAANQPMRIELKILSQDGISARRFSRMWIDGMAINNNPDLLTAQANNIVKFDALFKGRLVSGDHVVFKLAPNQGVEIRVNEVSLGKIESDKFFSLILSSWIGKIPLSSEFKDNMLKVGDIGHSLRSRFDQIKPANDRMSEVAAWAGQTQSSTASSSKSSSKSSVPKAELDAPIAVTSPKITLPPLVTNDSVSSSSRPTVTATTASSAQSDEDDEDSTPAFTTESLLARQFYLKELIKAINQRVRYPAKAAEKGQEGSVRVRVKLDRRGNIIAIEPVESSEYASLNREAVAAIKRAAPFAALPSAISGDSFEFTAPIRFTLLQKAKK